MNSTDEQSHFEAFRPSREISEVGKRALDAGIAVQLRKGVEFLYVNEPTYEYLMGEHNPIEVAVTCSCPQRSYPHELSIHSQLRIESYSPKLKFIWPWSLALSPRSEPSAERKAEAS
jgi:hypothetical protein